MRKTGAERMMESIRKIQGEFILMSEEERLKYLDRYELLQPYQKTALLQCRKYMSAAEKRKFKQVSEKAAASSKIGEDGPQPN